MIKSITLTLTPVFAGAVLLVAANFTTSYAKSARPAAINWYGNTRSAACFWNVRGIANASVQVNGRHEHFCIASGPLVAVFPRVADTYQFAPESDFAKSGCRLTLTRNGGTLRLADPGNSCACPIDAQFDGIKLRRSARPTMKRCSD